MIKFLIISCLIVGLKSEPFFVGTVDGNIKKYNFTNLLLAVQVSNSTLTADSFEIENLSNNEILVASSSILSKWDMIQLKATIQKELSYSLYSIMLIDQNSFITGTSNSLIRWNINDLSIDYELLNIHSDRITSLKFLESSFISGSYDYYLKRWNTFTLKEIGNLNIGGKILCMEVIGNAHVAVGLDVGGISIVNIDKFYVEKTFSLNYQITSLNFLSTKMLAFFDNFLTTKIWDTVSSNWNYQIGSTDPYRPGDTLVKMQQVESDVYVHGAVSGQLAFWKVNAQNQVWIDQRDLGSKIILIKSSEKFNKFNFTNYGSVKLFRCNGRFEASLSFDQLYLIEKILVKTKILCLKRCGSCKAISFSKTSGSCKIYSLMPSQSDLLKSNDHLFYELNQDGKNKEETTNLTEEPVYEVMVAVNLPYY